MTVYEDSGKHIIIRTDASIQIGTGHVMRCLALAQAWNNTKDRTIFLMAEVPPALKDRLRSEGMEVIHLSAQPGTDEDARQTAALALKNGAQWVVVDGYHFGSEYQGIIKDSGLRLLFIDDTGHLDHYWPDLVLNQNINADENLYVNKEPYTQLLLGNRYVLLRREFLNRQRWKRSVPQVAQKVMVTLGGGDPDNLTMKVLKALSKVDIQGLEVKAVVGPSNPHFKSLKNIMLSTPFSIHILNNVEDMSEFMSWADVAVSAGGSTCWELIFFGLPSIILVLAENQQKVTERLGSLGICLNMGWLKDINVSELTNTLKMLLLDPELRRTMSEKGQGLVDGKGAEHVVSAMKRITSSIQISDHFRVRRACIQDAEMLWQWANDTSVRSNSFYPEPIALDYHIKWYTEKLSSPKTSIWILEFKHIPVGQVRFDRVNRDTAEVDFFVVNYFRGQGFGTKALALTSNITYRELGVKCIRGVVFSSNHSSMRAFTKAHFDQVGEKHISDRLCHIFERKYIG